MPAERAALNAAVRQRKPANALEIGTWKGGGSTWQIASALRSNFDEYHLRGHLHTCETDPGFFEEAQKIYKTPEWENFVSCNWADSTAMIKKLQASHIDIDFVFFDGQEDPKLELEDFKLLDQTLKIGTVFSMHDWDLGERIDRGFSVKAKEVRPYLEGNPNWKIFLQLTSPVSVGMVFAVKIGL